MNPGSTFRSIDDNAAQPVTTNAPHMLSHGVIAEGARQTFQVRYIDISY